MIPNMIGLKKTELAQMAALGHTGALGNKLDYRDTDGAPINGV